MSDHPSSIETPLRRDCRRLSEIFFIACVILAALLLLERFGPWVFKRPGPGEVVAAITDLIPPIAYLTGLWRLAGTLSAFAQKGQFQTAIADGIKSVGIAMLFGGVFQTAIVPGLQTLAGHGPGYILGLDAAAITVAAVGGGLWAISRLFHKAARMETELEGIL